MGHYVFWVKIIALLLITYLPEDAHTADLLIPGLGEDRIRIEDLG